MARVRDLDRWAWSTSPVLGGCDFVANMCNGFSAGERLAPTPRAPRDFHTHRQGRGDDLTLVEGQARDPYLLSTSNRADGEYTPPETERGRKPSRSDFRKKSPHTYRYLRNRERNAATRGRHRRIQSSDSDIVEHPNEPAKGARDP